MGKKSIRLHRRAILQGGALSMVSLGLDPFFAARAATAASAVPLAAGARVKTLVCLFQRGAVDALSMVVPHAEASYYADRPRIAIGRPGSAGGAIDLDGRFGLHPRLAALEPIFRRKSLAIVHAVGSPNPTRSHFDAQHVMESGVANSANAPDGWLNRFLATEPAGTFRGIAVGPLMPLSLAGDAPALVIEDLAGFGIQTKRPQMRDRLTEAFANLYAGEAEARDIVAKSGHSAFDALATVRALDDAGRSPESVAAYPPGPLGKKLAQVARLIRANLGTRVIFLDAGGWDTHTAQGNSEQGRLAPLLADLGGSLAAFDADLGSRRDDVVVLTMSEFGRTVAENGSGGTDHGHGTAMFVMGGAVAGGRVAGKWPGLETASRYEGRDLAVTTDFRDLFAEIAVRHLGVRDPGALFPGFTVDPARAPGLFAPA